MEIYEIGIDLVCVDTRQEWNFQIHAIEPFVINFELIETTRSQSPNEASAIAISTCLLGKNGVNAPIDWIFTRVPLADRGIGSGKEDKAT